MGQTIKRPRRRWEDNIKINVKEIGSESVDMTRLSLARALRLILWTR
jgi:hypothetical protein